MTKFNPVAYDKILTSIRDSNMKLHDYSVLVINLVLFVLGYHKIPVVTMILFLVCVFVCTTACNLGLDKNYKLSNRLFSLSDILNNLILLCTLVSLVRVLWI